MKRLLGMGAALVAVTLSAAWAADVAPVQPAAPAANAAPEAAPRLAPAKTRRLVKASSEAPAYMFAKPVVLRGTLGEQKIQVHLRPKADIMEGIEGDYFAFGAPQKILLAGDLSHGVFVMEESQDGKKISGRWEGSQEGDTLRGTWTSAIEDTLTKPFVLTVVADKPRVVKAAAPIAKPAAPAAAVTQ